MFDALDVIEEKYGIKIEESIMWDCYDNAVLISYEMDFKRGVNVVIFGDYYLESVETRFKFADDVDCSIEQLTELSGFLELLTQEIKNYFKNLREKA
jgi:hypothetical protein